ncbi:hypothetical protein PAFU01_38330 [Pantoea ananatis]|nr:hypothetical protein PAFU01_38330 [Pantoea ananatis]
MPAPIRSQTATHDVVEWVKAIRKQPRTMTKVPTIITVRPPVRAIRGPVSGETSPITSMAIVSPENVTTGDRPVSDMMAVPKTPGI